MFFLAQRLRFISLTLLLILFFCFCFLQIIFYLQIHCNRNENIRLCCALNVKHKQLSHPISKFRLKTSWTLFSITRCVFINFFFCSIEKILKMRKESQLIFQFRCIKPKRVFKTIMRTMDEKKKRNQKLNEMSFWSA